MKKIAIITATRNKKSKVYDIADKLKSADTTENQYVIIDPVSYHVLPSDGENKLFSHGYSDLDSKDDISLVAKELQEADLIVSISPVFSHNIPGDYKNIIDRLAVWSHTFRLAAKPVVLIAVAESNGTKYVLNYLNKVFMTMGAVVIHKMEVTNLNTFETNEQFIDHTIEVMKHHLTSETIVYRPNEIQEEMFQTFKNAISKYPQDHFEYCYWRESKLFKANSLQEYFDMNKVS